MKTTSTTSATSTTSTGRDRLSLRRETLRTLTPGELRLVKGGAAFRSWGCGY